MTSFADVNFPLVILKDGGFDTAYDDSRESWEVQERIQLADSGDQERDNEQFYNNEQWDNEQFYNMDDSYSYRHTMNTYNTHTHRWHKNERNCEDEKSLRMLYGLA